MDCDIYEEYNEVPQVTDKPRKRQINKAKWKKNISKEAKYSAKALKDPTISCEHNNTFCAAKRLVSDDLVKFHDGYWRKKNAVDQKSWLMNYIDVLVPERERPGQGKSRRSKKKKTIFYRVQTKKGPVKVCRDTFLSIVNVGRRKVENAANDKINYCYAVPEKRGGARHKKKDLKEKVIEHIRKFKCRSIHYGRKKAPLRKYLPSELNIQKMWKMFCKNELDDAQKSECNYYYYYNVSKLLYGRTYFEIRHVTLLDFHHKIQSWFWKRQKGYVQRLPSIFNEIQSRNRQQN